MLKNTYLLAHAITFQCNFYRCLIAYTLLLSNKIILIIILRVTYKYSCLSFYDFLIMLCDTIGQNKMVLMQKMFKVGKKWIEAFMGRNFGEYRWLKVSFLGINFREWWAKEIQRVQTILNTKRSYNILQEKRSFHCNYHSNIYLHSLFNLITERGCSLLILTTTQNIQTNSGGINFQGARHSRTFHA